MDDDWKDALDDAFSTELVWISKNRCSVTDTIFGKLVFNPSKQIVKPSVTIFEGAGIYANGIAEFYLLEPYNGFESTAIGSITIEYVEQGSELLYFFVGRHYENFSLGYDLKDWNCVRITGVLNEKEVLNYLDFAMFIWGINSDEQKFSWPTCGTEEEPEWEEIHDPTTLKQLSSALPKHFEPFNAFNTGKRAKNKHEQFLQFYRVLEFFAERAADEKLINLKAEAITNEDYLKRVKSLSRSDERSTLSALVNLILEVQQDWDFIRGPEVLDDTTITPSKLSENIYDFRCSIVHAKEKHVNSIEPGERYSGEFVNSALLMSVELLAVLAIKRFGY